MCANTCALIADRGSYAVVDSHSRGATGLVEADRKSVVLYFGSIGELYNHICRLAAGFGGFEKGFEIAGGVVWLAGTELAGTELAGTDLAGTELAGTDTVDIEVAADYLGVDIYTFYDSRWIKYSSRTKHFSNTAIYLENCHGKTNLCKRA